jgi:hypothetical protein
MRYDMASLYASHHFHEEKEAVKTEKQEDTEKHAMAHAVHRIIARTHRTSWTSREKRFTVQISTTAEIRYNSAGKVCDIKIVSPSLI